MKSRLLLIASLHCLFIVSLPVHAAWRTFVASTGNDANPCSLTQPCRGFARALTQTYAGGEVIVLDSAGYGPVWIGLPVSIIAPPGVYAGISVSSAGTATGVEIIGPAAKVVLRGLSIISTSGSLADTGGKYGIRMTSGTELSVEDCVIAGFVGDASGVYGTGVSIETQASVRISGTVIRGNRYGVNVGFGATANVVNSQIVNNGEEGIQVYGGSSGATTNIHIADTLVSGSSFCILNYAAPSTFGYIFATRVTVTACGHAIANDPPGSGTTTVSNSMVTGNAFGLTASSGTLFTLGNNHVNGNTANTNGSVTTIGTL